MLSQEYILVLTSTISYHGYHMQKWLVVKPISKRSFCKEILEHVIEISNFSVTKCVLDLSLNMYLQLGNAHNKNIIQKVVSNQRKAPRFILKDYDRDSSASKMIKELNCCSI